MGGSIAKGGGEAPPLPRAKRRAVRQSPASPDVRWRFNLRPVRAHEIGVALIAESEGAKAAAGTFHTK